jgi:sn-glycerol 3-phosphate transport system permease protein
VLLQAITVPTAAYAFARLRFPGRDVLFVLFLGAMIIPVHATIFPSFLLLSALRWADTYLALTIPFGASAFGVFLLRQAFLSIPEDLVDAAKIDGATHLQILMRVLVPIARPMLLTFLLLSATWRWNDYFWPLVMTSTPEMRTLPVGVVFLHSSEGPTRWHVVTAATMMTIAPTLLLFAVLQRQFVDGLTRTGIKG